MLKDLAAVIGLGIFFLVVWAVVAWVICALVAVAP
jgi:hypothetical protein